MKSSLKSASELAVIGTAEFVVLPEHSDQPIPAKVDTGADSSSIWASEVNEQEGTLTFVLFAPHSAFYTGNEITTTRYRVTRVKNSFGVEEYRYRIWLKVVIAGKAYRTSFTLANRANNRYPILIGKRFLKKRFLVDVSRHNVMSPKQRGACADIVVMTPRTDEDTVRFFEGVAEQVGSPVSLMHYRNLDYSIDETGAPHISLPNGIDLGLSPIVYLKAYRNYPDHALAIAKYLQYRHVPFADRELERGVSLSKTSELFYLATEGISVPQSYLEMKHFRHHSYDDVAARVGTPFVIKDADSDRGKNNYLVTDEASFAEAVSRLAECRTLVVQRYIHNEGFYRVVVLHNKAVQVVYRAVHQHDDPLKAHLNKPAGSVNARVVPVAEADSEMVALAIRAAMAMRRDVAGVDVIQDKRTKQWYVIEVNYNPEMLKGINQHEKQAALAAYLKQEGGIS